MTMKVNKLLIMIAALSMCVTGCNLFKKKGNSSTPESSDVSPSSVTPSEPSSPSEPDEDVFPEPGDPLTPPQGSIGFPRDAVNTFLNANELTSYVVPAVAEDQTWGTISYTYFPILKLWTRECTTGTLYEQQYYNLLDAEGITIEDKHYDKTGYIVFDSKNRPQIAFKSAGDYFLLYICAPEYEITSTVSGAFPREQLAEYFDLMNIANMPPFPTLPLTSGWQYQNYFYSETHMWRLFIRNDDPSTPDSENYEGRCLEDDYLELLEADGWTIDRSLYDSKGYFATKEWAEIQFFSWNNDFRLWIYKK